MARRYACARTVSTGQSEHVEVAVIGAGVVGCAISLALARRGVEVLLLEAESAPALAASGTNSGVLHTGFDSTPGELETDLILRSGQLRDEVMAALGIPALRCGAVMRAGERAPEVLGLARQNGVPAESLGDGAVRISGEAVTDPVAYTLALAAEAARHGAGLLLGHRVVAIDRGLRIRTDGGAVLGCSVVVNCAGLYADAVARLVGDDSFEIFPRKGEFLVFDAPAGAPLDHIELPVPTTRTKGVLVFPTTDGKVVAGPTAVDQRDKRDWSVRPQAEDEILPKAIRMYPPLEGAEPIAAYAGLRPAGRGVNYLIGSSPACAQMINVAAIRSTGLTASLGIAEHVARIVESLGVRMGAPRALIGDGPPPARGPWWRRTAQFRAGERAA